MINESKLSIIQKRGYPKEISGDKFSLYISNYPIIVEYLSKRVGNPNKTLVELCCGIGVTLMYLKNNFKKIIGVDIDKKILNYSSKNLKLVKLEKKSELICGDVNDLELFKRIKADVVVYDIPYWQEHESEGKGDLTKKNPELKSLVDKIKKYISGDIVIFAPPKYSYSLIKSQLGELEYEKIFINGKYDRNIVYLGNLKKKTGVTSKYLQLR